MTEYRGPRGRGRPRQVEVEKVAGVALRLFADRGFERTTVDDISRAAGIGRSTFFRYFPSKRHVFVHCQAEQVLALESSLAQLHGATDPFASVVESLLEAARAVGADQVAATRDQQALFAARPDLQEGGRRWSERRVTTISNFLTGELRETEDAMVPLAFALAVDGALRAAGVRFAQSTGRPFGEFAEASLAPIYAGFRSSTRPGAS